MLRELIPLHVLRLLDAHGIDPGALDGYEVDATTDPITVRLRVKPKLDVIEVEIVKDAA